MIYKYDCRYFNGEKPCQFKRPCENCGEYSPMGTRIVIVKLAAMGDVLRTTPILSALKSEYPLSHITWVVDSASYELLDGNPRIDRVMRFNAETCMQLELENFDLVLSLDKEGRAVSLVMRLQAQKKLGFGLSVQGNIFPMNPECEYAFRLGVDDDLKFDQNSKTYQEIIFEALGMKYKGESYEMVVRPEDEVYAKNFLMKAGVEEGLTRVAICPGAGALFANKAWTVDGYCKLINNLSQLVDVQVLLMGGKAETSKNAEIKACVEFPIVDVGNHHSITQFSAIVKQCDLMICGDTLPMHLAIGHGKHVLAIFGPTCPQEIDLYGKGEIIMSGIDCAPCYKRTCDIVDNCMVKIPSNLVSEKALHLIEEIRC